MFKVADRFSSQTERLDRLDLIWFDFPNYFPNYFADQLVTWLVLTS